jgi:ClpP class serine protease
MALTTAELTPPEAVQDAARRGVELHEAGRSGDGLKPETIRRANSIADGEPQSEQWATVEAPAWFARHADDFERGVDDQNGEETPGYVAWLLWGGDPGRRWVERLKETDMRRDEDTGASMAPAELAVLAGHARALSAPRPARVLPDGAVGSMHLEGGLYPYDYDRARYETATAMAERHPVLIIHVDSPGGYVSGVVETRRAIARAQAAGVYVVAYVYGTAASAALWVISGADEIVASPTAQVGGVGVVVTLYVEDAEHVVEVVSTQTPSKRASVDDGDYLAALQRRVDALAEVMLDDIARGRGVSREALGDGSVYSAQDAVERGLVDRIATDADDWMFMGGRMPLDYPRAVRTAPALASLAGGTMEALVTEQEAAAMTARNEELAREVERLKGALSADAERANAAELALRTRDAEAIVDGAIRETRIPQASRGSWVERAVRIGLDDVRAMLSDMVPQAQVGSATGHGGAAEPTPPKTARELEIARANDMLAQVRAANGGHR